MLPTITFLNAIHIDANGITSTLIITACNPREDKYSKKVYKYFVEYADKESKKKTYSETERRVSEKEQALKSLVFLAVSNGK